VTYWDDENERWVRAPARGRRLRSRVRQQPSPLPPGPPPGEPPTVGGPPQTQTQTWAEPWAEPWEPLGLTELAKPSEPPEPPELFRLSKRFGPSELSRPLILSTPPRHSKPFVFSRRAKRRTAFTAAAAAAGTLAGAGATALAAVLLAGGGSEVTSTVVNTPARVGSAGESPEAPDKGTISREGPDTPDALYTPVPPGFSLRSDPDGFVILTPTDWVRWTKKNSVYYGTKDRSRAIQVFPLTEPTPEKSLEKAVDLATRHSDYRRVSLTFDDPGGGDAVVHEYRYVSEKFGERFVIDRRFTAQEGTRYAVLAVGPVADQAELTEIHGRATWFFAESE
jgi:hypothetical protein